MESLKKLTNKKIDLQNSDPSKANSELIEELWESVLKAECPEEHANRLIKLKHLSYIDNPNISHQKTLKNEIASIVNSMDLAESIEAARAFSLYFQLVNILEQRVEEDRYIQSFTKKSGENRVFKLKYNYNGKY